MKAIAAVALILLAGAASADTAAVADAERWMALVDASRYAESRSAAGPSFQKGVTKAAWTRSVRAAREPLGALVSRVLLKEKASTSLPGAPDGTYDIVQFTSEFAHKKAAVETTVLANEGNGWRVVGYFVK